MNFFLLFCHSRFGFMRLKNIAPQTVIHFNCDTTLLANICFNTSKYFLSLFPQMLKKTRKTLQMHKQLVNICFVDFLPTEIYVYRA